MIIASFLVGFVAGAVCAVFTLLLLFAPRF